MKIVKRNDFKCPKCGRNFTLKGNLEKHKRNVDCTKPKRSNESQSKPPVIELFKCNICFKSYKLKSDLKIHKLIHINKTQECPKCKKVFISKRGYKLHMENNRNKQCPYPCKICNKVFFKASSYTKHVSMHNGRMVRVKKVEVAPEGENKAFNCKFCDKEFNFKNTLKLHEKTHTEERPYVCKHCKKSFKNLYPLKLHLRFHTGERPYKCSECFKSFVTSSQFGLHKKIHSGLRPYVCEICSKGFVMKVLLNKHMVVHTREKFFHCNYCKKSFSYRESLKIHLRIHTGEKPYKCLKCNTSFQYLRYLKDHDCYRAQGEKYKVKIEIQDDRLNDANNQKVGNGKKKSKHSKQRTLEEFFSFKTGGAFQTKTEGEDEEIIDVGGVEDEVVFLNCFKNEEDEEEHYIENENPKVKECSVSLTRLYPKSKKVYKFKEEEI